MNTRQFAKRIHHELDEMGVPERADERIEIFAKLIKAPRFKAEAILNGTVIPDEKLLHILAEELEVSIDWLLDREHE